MGDNAGVDIAAHGTHDRHNGLKFLNHIYAAYVAGVPHFVAIGEVAGETVVPTGVGVRKNADAEHGKMGKDLGLRLGTVNWKEEKRREKREGKGIRS